MASSIFRVYVRSSVSWGSEFFARSPTTLRLMDTHSGASPLSVVCVSLGTRASRTRHVFLSGDPVPCAGINLPTLHHKASRWRCVLINSGPDRLVYGRGSSPEQVRLCGLARWGHGRLPCGRPTRHAGLPEVADSVISPCSGPSGAESHRRLWRHGATIPGSLTLGQATQLSWLRACTHPICW